MVQTLTDNVELLYLHTEVYVPQSEAALCYNDKILNIRWPLALTEISERDRANMLITPHFNGIQL